MGKLTEKDIDYIRRDLRRRGLIQDSLRSELVDHISCEVEELVQSGIPFKKAYEKVLSGVTDQNFSEVQTKSFQAQNYNLTMLFRNQMKIMFRSMMKSKMHSIITIGGLALGLACFTIIALYVIRETKYDSGFSNASSLYRVTMSSTVGGKTNHIPTSFPAIGSEIKAQSAAIENYVRIINYKYSRYVPTLELNDKIFYEERIIFADSTFFQLFDFPFLEGNPALALEKPASIVLTKAMARKYFGDEPALGKHLVLNGKNELEITGVVEEIPSDTHLKFDFVIPMSGIDYSGAFTRTVITDIKWDIDWFWTYFLIPDKRAVPQVEESLNKMIAGKIPDYVRDYKAKFYLQSMKDVHLYSTFDYGTDMEINGDIKSLAIFASVGILVLLISGINFVNITVASASQRYKEVGVSKVLGAMRSTLRWQFLGETVLISMVSFMIGLFLVKLCIPVFAQLLDSPLEFNLVEDRWIYLLLFGFSILVGALSGAYPALFISSFQPQRILKGAWNSGKGNARFREALLGVQIAISIFLIIGTLVIFNQLNFIRNKSLGYDKEQIIMLQVRGTGITRKYAAFKDKLKNESSIVSVSSVSEPIGREVQFMGFRVEGKEEIQLVKILNVTHDFVQTMGLQMASGRDFSREFITDSTSGFLINEAFAKSYGWDDPIGKGVTHAFFQNRNPGKVIGVIKDFNFEPLQKQIDPLIVFFGHPAWFVAVKINTGDIQSTLGVLERTWKEFEPDRPFSYHFLDQSIQRVYDKEQRVSQVFMVFSILSIFTAALGLYGLISFVANQRLMEIGIRKVLGASVSNILQLLTKDYVLLVFIAFIVASPISYFIMNQWLEGFAFRIPWNFAYFLIGLLAALVIVSSTVILKAMGAARRNPVEILKSE